MKVYIASSLRNKKTDFICKKLKENNIEYYNPAVIDLDERINAERIEIFNKCLHEIEYNCNILLAIAPYGRSVSGEVAYAGCLKSHGMRKIIILYNSSSESPCIEEMEAIQAPFFDVVFNDLQDLIRYIIKLDCSRKMN